MQLIHCPQEAGPYLYDYKLRVFLAGGITGCPEWQRDVIAKLEGENILVMNPRREGFDASDPSMEEHQIDWEYRHILYADVMFFWFPEETLCPITLFELGKCAADKGYPLIVGCHPGYKRRRDVIIQLGLMGIPTTVRDSLEAVIEDLKAYRGVYEND